MIGKALLLWWIILIFLSLGVMLWTVFRKSAISVTIREDFTRQKWFWVAIAVLAVLQALCALAFAYLGNDILKSVFIQSVVRLLKIL